MGQLYSKIRRVVKNNDSRTLVSNFTWLAILKVIGFSFPLITLPYLSRVIGVDKFGEIAFAASIMVFVETFVDFGFNYTATRDIARQRGDINAVSKIFSNVLWAKIFLMIIGFIVISVCAFTIPFLSDKRLLLFLTFLYIPGHIVFPDWFFQAMERMKYITIMNVLSRLAFTVLVFVLIKQKSDYILQPLLTAVGFWVSGMGAMCLIVRKFRVKILPPSISGIREMIKSGRDMFLSLLFPNLYTNFSTILLRSSCGDIATGLYDSGKRFINITDQLFQVLSRVFYPFLARKMEYHSLYVKISGSVSLLASVSLFCGADWLVNVFYTSEFQPAVIVIKILSIAPVSLFLMNTYGVNYLVLVGKEKTYRNIILFYSVIGFILTWILTLKYSYLGTAITISSVWFLRGLTTFMFAKYSENRSR